MDNALEQLEQLVLRAEFSVRSESLKTALDNASSRLRDAEQAHAAGVRQLQEVRQRRVPEIDRCKRDEQRLVELLQKAARLQPHLDPQQIETLADESRTRTRTAFAAATAELQSAERAVQEALARLEQATAEYQQTRREYERLLPQGHERPMANDEVLARALELFPAGRLKSLDEEVQQADWIFGRLSRTEQFYQLSVWVGRLRQLQGETLTDEEQRRTKQLFGQLVGISKQYEPGYIEAFRQEFSADWPLFIAEHEKHLKGFGEKRRAESDEKRRRAEQEQAARAAAQGALEQLRTVIEKLELPERGVDEFREALGRLHGISANDPQLLDLLLPYRELLTEGSEFRAIRRNLDKLVEAQDAESRAPVDVIDLLPLTEGKRCVIIGGSRREDVRQQLQQRFRFVDLQWEDYERTHGAKLGSLEQRVRTGGLDLMLILRSFVHHHVTEKLRPLCKQHGVPCFMVDRGYGAAQIAATLRQRPTRVESNPETDAGANGRRGRSIPLGPLSTAARRAGLARAK